jgi:hypothetical protein
MEILQKAGECSLNENQQKPQQTAFCLHFQNTHTRHRKNTPTLLVEGRRTEKLN